MGFVFPGPLDLTNHKKFTFYYKLKILNYVHFFHFILCLRDSRNIIIVTNSFNFYWNILIYLLRCISSFNKLANLIWLPTELSSRSHLVLSLVGKFSISIGTVDLESDFGWYNYGNIIREVNVKFCSVIEDWPIARLVMPAPTTGWW